MSDLFPLFDDDDGDGDDGGDRPVSGDGRRSVWTVLTVLAFAAAVVVLAIVLLRSPSSPHHHDDQLAGPTAPASTSASVPVSEIASRPATPTTGPARTSSHPTKSPSSTPSTSASTSPTKKPTTPRPTPTKTTSGDPIGNGPCPNTSPCRIGGDGGAIAHVDGVRQDSVPGYISGAAQTCAVQAAEGAPCSLSKAYGVFPETSENGARAVDDIIAANGDWLKDKKLAGFQVGWAYNPTKHLYYCAIIEGPPTG
jgi:hypothetical protein